jgi:putative ABC transport system ATP-binding protein
VTGREVVGELSAVALTAFVGGRTIFTDLDLVAEGGRWLTIAGPTGSGKSLLLHVLAGLVRPTRGEVLIDGVPAWQPPGRHPRPAIVMQDDDLMPVLTSAETVALPLQARKLPRVEIRARVTDSLAALGLSGAADQLVTQLSGGQRQRVAIARALAMSSPILLLDEPTAELDAANRDNVLGLLKDEASAGAVVIVVSHDPAVLECSDTVTVLGDTST